MSGDRCAVPHCCAKALVSKGAMTFGIIKSIFLFGALESISLLAGLPGIICFKSGKRSSCFLMPVPEKVILRISYNKDINPNIKLLKGSDKQIFLFAQRLT
jgi:hypothetical protein